MIRNQTHRKILDKGTADAFVKGRAAAHDEMRPTATRKPLKDRLVVQQQRDGSWSAHRETPPLTIYDPYGWAVLTVRGVALRPEPTTYVRPTALAAVKALAAAEAAEKAKAHKAQVTDAYLSAQSASTRVEVDL